VTVPADSRWRGFVKDRGGVADYGLRPITRQGLTGEGMAQVCEIAHISVPATVKGRLKSGANVTKCRCRPLQLSVNVIRANKVTHCRRVWNDDRTKACVPGDLQGASAGLRRAGEPGVKRRGHSPAAVSPVVQEEIRMTASTGERPSMGTWIAEVSPLRALRAADAMALMLAATRMADLAAVTRADSGTYGSEDMGERCRRTRVRSVRENPPWNSSAASPLRKLWEPSRRVTCPAP
jgi:hypothetical protein